MADDDRDEEPLVDEERRGSAYFLIGLVGVIVFLLVISFFIGNLSNR
jgi:hypothetical protein